MPANESFSDVRHARIIGAGLIGTSIGLALSARGVVVSFEDSSPANAELASALTGGLISDPTDPELVIVATPISAIGTLVLGSLERYPESIVIDIGGLKSKVLHEVLTLSVSNPRYVSVHPMAGREISGPGAARADLFEGRAWIVTASPTSSEKATEIALALGEILGSTTYRLGPAEHDATIGLVSHLPQMVSSLLGSVLASRNPEELLLAGQGLRDTTRLAASDSGFWSELLLANADVNIELLNDYATRLSDLVKALSEKNEQALVEILDSGRTGQKRIPGKHGARVRDYTYLPVVIKDAPGQLAALFDECARAGVNVEDLSIEHSPGQSTGLITLALSESDAEKLQIHLKNLGWSAHQPRK